MTIEYNMKSGIWLAISIVVVLPIIQTASTSVDSDAVTREDLNIILKRLDAVENELKMYKSENKELAHALAHASKRQAAPETIAFYAILSGARCIHTNEVIIFDTEETNNGGGYNANDGIFDVPSTGLYVFTVTVVADFHDCIEAEIVVDGTVKGTTFSDSDEIHDIHPGSKTIVVHANAGDHVFVRRGNGCKCNVISDSSHGQTSFAGWILF